MPITLVQLGSPRRPGEGLRIGTVRRPPRGVPRSEFAARDFYDVWLPEAAPSEELRKVGQAAGSEKDWLAFERKYRAEMKEAGPSRLLDLLAALSHGASFSVGCYCPDEARCHRSILRELLREHGAAIEGEGGRGVKAAR